MLRRVCNILIALVVVLALTLVGVLGVPLLMGRQLYAVETASMEPTYPVGSIVVVDETPPESIQAGDVITFENASYQTAVTHRVLEVDPENRQYLTQGDNNEFADFYPVSFDALMGRVQYHIPKLGVLVSGIRTMGGIIIMLWVLLFIVLLLFLPDLVARKKAMNAEKAAERAGIQQTTEPQNAPPKPSEPMLGKPGEGPPLVAAPAHNTQSEHSPPAKDTPRRPAQAKRPVISAWQPAAQAPPARPVTQLYSAPQSTQDGAQRPTLYKKGGM